MTPVTEVKTNSNATTESGSANGGKIQETDSNGIALCKQEN
jgi:hypothetical protein